MEDEEAVKRNLNNLWRCIIVCGDVEGMAGSCRKVVAKEMAAHEFLRKLREEYPDAEVPSYDPPFEFFIHPQIFRWVEELGTTLGLKLEFGKPVKTLGSKGLLKSDTSCMYVSTCCIGDHTFQGMSTDEKYSSIDAARKVWEFFTGEKFPYTRHLMGLRCNPLLKYDFVKSEVQCYKKMDENEELKKTANANNVVNKVNQEFPLNDFELDSDADDEDTFPVDSFASALKKNRDLNEKLKEAKRAEERKKMIKKN